MRRTENQRPAGQLETELKQQRPFATSGEAALVGLLKTADLVRRHLSAVVSPHGITIQQYNVLRILRGAGKAGLPTLEVADRMIEQTPGVTRLLDRLEAKKLVRRQRCAADRRQHLCWIAEAGTELLDKLEPLLAHAGEQLLTAMNGEQRARLARLLDAIRASHLFP